MAGEAAHLPATLHGSAVARQGAGVLLLGKPGSGKSSLAARLIDRGFDLVADDRVVLCEGEVSAPEQLAGLIALRGLGILRIPFVAQAHLVLAVALDSGQERAAERHLPDVHVPMLFLDAFAAETPLLIEWALDVVQGSKTAILGALA